MNEAVLNDHDSVASAPRRRSAVTIVASRIESCGGRRTYTHVVIHFHKGHRKRSKLVLSSYLPPCSATPGQTASAAEFRARPRGAFVSCGMYAEPAAPQQVICEAFHLTSGSGESTEQVARLHPDGQVISCAQPLTGADNRCRAGDAGEGIPTYAAGKRIAVGPFICAVLTAGVECTVSPSGKGFLITPDEIAQVGS